MDRSFDNAASRLRYWIDLFMEKPGGDLLVNAAADILEVDADFVSGRAEVMRLGAALADMCAEVRREVEKLPPDSHPDLLLADFGQVEAAVDVFTVSRHQSVSGLTAQIDAAGHRGLEMIDRHLHTKRAQTWIADSVRLELIDLVEELMDQVYRTDVLDEEVKAFVLIRLEAVEKALRDALLTGTPGIEHATEALIGSMHRRRDVWNQIKDTPFGDRIRKVSLALCFALGAANGVPALMPGDDGQQPEDSQVEIQKDPLIDIGNIKIEVGRSGDVVNVNQGDDDVVDGEIVEEVDHADNEGEDGATDSDRSTR
ncbi:hypothetical protein ACIO3S_20930 [Nocardioides sp. NPDC087217]|uniref:hypothetical protein n=1 Tax=Nocardioides sp. NPDC087217 TaxID=3364335 RepID=UPI00381CC869